MKTKLEMAHDYALTKLSKKDHMQDMGGLVIDAWAYADTMQAEADKRNYPEKQDSSEWQPDWSQAPSSRATHWSKESDGTTTWWIGEPTLNIKEGTHHDNDDCACLGDAPSFNYQGDWKDSLSKRP